ncbi:MAG: ankyrin repeat domain-containing protein [Polyangiaceae bacterium]
MSRFGYRLFGTAMIGVFGGLSIGACSGTPKVHDGAVPAPSSVAAPLPRWNVPAQLDPLVKGVIEPTVEHLESLRSAEVTLLSRDGRHIDVNRAPGPSTKLTVLLASPRDQPASRTDALPTVCATLDRDIQVCRGGECWSQEPGKTPTVVCNLEVFHDVEALLQVQSDTVVFDAALKSDVALIKLLDDVKRSPEKVFRSIPVESVAFDMVPMAVFFLAHEIRHLADAGKGRAFDADGEEPSRRSLQIVNYCRNSAEFEQQGWPIVAAPDVETAAPDAATSAFLSESRKIWAEELTADRFAAGILLGTLQVATERDPVLAANLHDMALKTFTLFGMRSWYASIGEVLHQSCPDLLSSRYAISRCLCRAGERRADAAAIFGMTHAPLALRMARLVDDLLPRFSSRMLESREQKLRSVLTGALSGTGALARSACASESKPGAAPLDVFGLEGPWSRSATFGQEWACECAPGSARDAEIAAKLRPSGGCEGLLASLGSEPLPDLTPAPPLHQAVARGALDEIDALLARGEDPDQVDPVRERTALLLVTMAYRMDVSTRLKILRRLVKGGASVNKVGPDGMSPLVAAILGASSEIVEELVSLGADVNLPVRMGNTPLSMVVIVPQAEDGKPDVILRFLLAHGANPNVANERGETPLIRAAGCPYGSLECGFPQRIKLLRDAGANVRARDKAGKSALDRAREQGSNEILPLLR